MTASTGGGSVLVLDRADAERPALRAALAAVGLHEVKLDDLPAGKPLAEQLKDVLQTVRFVLLVLDKRPIPPWTIFEAGLAQGMGVPVALLDGREPSFGSDLDELAFDTLLVAPRLFARIANTTGLIQELSAYLDGLEAPDAVIGNTYLQAKHVHSAERRSKERPHHYSEVERRVAEIIENAGGILVTDRPKNRPSPDFVFLLPQLDSAINPVLVEVKQKSDLEHAHRQLARALDHANAHLGLLVTSDQVPLERRRVGPLQVVTQVSLYELEREPDQLVRLLTEARNLAVHG